MLQIEIYIKTEKRKEKLCIIDPWYHPIPSLKTFLIVYDHSSRQSMWPSDVSWILIFNRRKWNWKVLSNIIFISYIYIYIYNTLTVGKEFNIFIPMLRIKLPSIPIPLQEVRFRCLFSRRIQDNVFCNNDLIFIMISFFWRRKPLYKS